MESKKIMMEQFLDRLTNYCQEETVYWKTTNSIVSSIKIDPKNKIRVFVLAGGVKDFYYSFNIMGLSLVWYEDEGVWRAFENMEEQFRLEV